MFVLFETAGMSFDGTFSMSVSLILLRIIYIYIRLRSNIIIIKILTVIMQYIFIHKKVFGVLLEIRYFLFDLALGCSCLRHLHKLSFRPHNNYSTLTSACARIIREWQIQQRWTEK